MTASANPPRADRHQLVEEAARWFLSTFPDVTNYETAYDYSNWALMSMPFVRGDDYFLFTCKLAVAEIWIDDGLYRTREGIMIADALDGIALPDEASEFCHSMVGFFDEFAALCQCDSNYEAYRDYLCKFIRLATTPELTFPMKYHRRVYEVGMMPFYAITADSHGKELEVSDEFVEYGIYGTEVDNRPCSFVAEFSDESSRNPLLQDSSDQAVDKAVDDMFEHYCEQYSRMEFDFWKVVAHQGRLGSFMWSLQSKRYGLLMKNAVRENTRGNLLHNIQNHVTKRPLFVGYR
ncbi:hypothetical protein J7F03_40290 [Streptomyces sp. ISL-43]|uniref:hypothetical protein n=1 Tax=Streptomyces sp. ISL-43 TaxID=2819183 RepID=UPI001BEC658E|nr:hypothetical protein [Streptomyces sp. ISL-43]MBT2453150.1 hypothetical protein [Streptomyces sp. ISL-43]